MRHLLRTFFIFTMLLSAEAFASETVLKVFEQDEDGKSVHRALDRSSIGDGLDPLLQFILLEQPLDPDTMQVVWEASESLITWARNDDVPSYRMIEHALLPNSGFVVYRVYAKSGEELASSRHTRTAEDPDFSVEPEIIDGLPDGEYSLHASLVVPNRPNTLLIQRIEVSDDAMATLIDDKSEAPGLVPVLVPGGGFNGETAQPAAVGNRTTNTMARWDVVPFQMFDGVFEVGILAFHAYGIDRVEMSFNGGPWQSIREPSLNPRTKVNEYWAKIDANNIDDGPIELRAIAYPKDGTPRLLETLVLRANAGGTLSETVVELQAGVQEMKSWQQVSSDRWLIVRPAPGVAKEDVILTGIGRHNRGNIKFEGLTIRPGAGNQGLGKGGLLWFDNVDYAGVDVSQGGKPTWWMADTAWDAKYHTDMNITQLQTAFHAGSAGIIRNVKLDSIYEDVVRQAGLIANVTIEDLTAANASYHPDVFQWYGQTPTNMIVYNFVAKRVAGQGLFPGNLKDCAFVGLDLNIVGQYRPLQMQGETENVLIQDSKLVGELGGILRYDKGFEPKDVVFRNYNVDVAPKHSGPPLGWKHEQIKVYPQQEND